MNNFNSDEWRQKRIASMRKRRFEYALEQFEEGYASYTTVSDLFSFYRLRIVSLSDTINRLAKSYPDDPPIEEECGEIETYLGLSFVACQFLITDTEGACLIIHEMIQKKLVNGHSAKRWCIMQRGSKLVTGTPYSLIEALDAAANYYKHGAAWIGDWNELKKERNTGRTISTIETLGAMQNSTGNFRTLFKAITQNDDFENLDQLLRVLQSWRDELKLQYRKALKLLTA